MYIREDSPAAIVVDIVSPISVAIAMIRTRRDDAAVRISRATRRSAFVGAEIGLLLLLTPPLPRSPPPRRPTPTSMPAGPLPPPHPPPPALPRATFLGLVVLLPVVVGGGICGVVIEDDREDGGVGVVDDAVLVGPVLVAIVALPANPSHRSIGIDYRLSIFAASFRAG
jgi:hypothetical protein